MNPLPGNPVRGSSSGRPIMALFDILGRRWSMRILWELNLAPCTFRDLQARCDKLSSSVLNTRLSELKEALLVTLEPQGYCLTPLAEEPMQHIALLRGWSAKWARACETQDTGA